jgi:hypothetical protein
MTTNVQIRATDKEAREHLKLQLAQYLAEQPESTQSLHRWMKRLEMAGAGIIAAAFIVALYVSIAWKSVNPTMIPIAWFFFAACLSLMVVLFGLHASLIRAYPPVVFPGKVQKFVSGLGAVWIGVGSIVGGLIMAAVWAGFAYSTATFNLAMIVPLTNTLGVVMSIAIVISIVYSIYQKASRSR